MKWKTALKKALAAALAVVTVCTFAPVSPLREAIAAGTYGLKLQDPETGKEGTDMTIIEGSNAIIKATLPAGYTITANNPFNIFVANSSDNKNSDFSIESTSNTHFNLLAKNGITGAAGEQDYDINAIYSAQLDTATGTGYCAADPTDPVAKPMLNFSLDVTASQVVNVLEESTLKFTATGDEQDTGTDTSSVDISKFTGTGNVFQQYNNTQQRGIQIQKDARGRYFMLNLRPAVGGGGIDLKVYIIGLPITQKIRNGTSFTIEFRRETLNPLKLKVVSPQRFVDNMAAEIQAYPTTSQELTETGRPYVQLAAGDDLQAITQNFTMYSKLHKYNVNPTIKWSWIPDDPRYQSVARINDRQGGGAVAFQAFEIIDRPQEDVRGSLGLVVSYGGKVSSQLKIPIMIIGTGVPPSITPLKAWRGNPKLDSGSNPLVQTITELPKDMDVYQGGTSWANYPTEPRGPYKFTFYIDYGKSRGQAQNLKIVATTGGEKIEIRVDGAPVPYDLNTSPDIPNNGAIRNFEITAVAEGQVRLQFQFYDGAGAPMTANWLYWYKQSGPAYIYDSSPRTDGTLAALTLRGVNETGSQSKFNEIYPPDGVLDFGFTPEQNEYNNITVPYKAEKITLQPRIPAASGAKNAIEVEVDGVVRQVRSNEKTDPIGLTVQVPKIIRLTVTAEDGSKNTYTLRVTRQLPSSNSTLSKLEAYRVDPAGTENLIKNFPAAGNYYAFEVPYGMKKVRVVAEPSDPWATAVIEPRPVTTGILFWKSEEFIDLKGTYDPVTDTMTDNVTTIKVTVKAEEGTTSIYTIDITRKKPDNNQRLGSLVVLDENGKEIDFLKNGAKTTFDPATKSYMVSIPYSTKKVTIRANAESEQAQDLKLKYPPVYENGKTDTKKYVNKDTPAEWYYIDVSQKEKPDERLNQFTFEVATTAESGNVTNPPYTIVFEREPANRNNALSDLILEDQAGVRVSEGFSFNAEQLEYEFSVPYLTQSLKVTPKPESALSTVTVNGTKLTVNKDYAIVQLETGIATTITIVVTAEDASTRTYTLKVTRSKPSTECRLADLKVDALELKPKFVPAKTSYTTILPVGTRSFTVTATTVDPYATLTINKLAAASGVATAPITPVEVQTKVEIVVTAQDGKTTKTYIVTVTDDNLVEKNNNGDLKSLTVTPGDMVPKFRPGNLEYEMSVKPDTYSVEIVPITSDRHAKVEVYQGTRKLRDYDGNFTSSLMEDENEFRIEVTPSDKSEPKKYYVTVYRNDEEKQRTMTPTTAEMVDWTQNPIVIDISKYHIVAADVFNTLKTEYPDKTIIFEGNDYSLEVKGTDLKRLVPSTEQFDFALSFTSPEEEAVWDLINEHTRNDDVDPVFVYFKHHGELPAPMKFTLSLGSEYRNATMYWNYYNEERDRIDHYGSVKSNTKGTFTVQLTHMSTYLVAKQKIVGAEDRTGMNLGGSSVGNYGIEMTDDKLNPNTGVAGR